MLGERKTPPRTLCQAKTLEDLGGPKKMEGTLWVGTLAVVLEGELHLLEFPRGRLGSSPFLRKGEKDLLPFEPQDHKAKKTGRSLA